MEKKVMTAVIGATAVSLFYPPLHFPLLLAILIGVFAFGLFKMFTKKDATVISALLVAVGMLSVGVMATELGHASVAVVASPDLNVVGFNVSLIDWTPGQGNVNIGYTMLEYDENLMVDSVPSPALQSQMLNTVLAGGVVLAIISALFFISPTPTNGPALLWMLMLITHNMPIYANDTTMAMSEFGATPLWGWATFFVLLLPVIGAMAYSLRRGDELI